MLTGRITIESSPDLRETLLKQLASPGCRTSTIDFNEVAYVDTSGLAILVEILKAARTQGKEFQLSASSSEILTRNDAVAAFLP